MNAERIPRNSVAMAGEFAVLSQLFLRGYDASMTLGHTKSIDILVLNPKTRETFQVEVKTNLESRSAPTLSKTFGKFVTDWQLHEKNEAISAPQLFYAFVHINQLSDKASFRFFIVPSAVVAKYAQESHRHWLKCTPDGKDTERRLFKLGLRGEQYPIDTPLVEDYENNWEFRTL